MALTTPYYGECWNPTEAGGSMDYTGMTTKSELQYITLSGSSISSQVCNYHGKDNNDPLALMLFFHTCCTLSISNGG